MPHLLISGSTGSGKSTLLNSLIASIVFDHRPDEVQFVIIDLKQVEFTHYTGCKHLAFEPATSIYQALERMQYLIDEMERRLKTFAKHGYRNILEYNTAQQRLNNITQTAPLPYYVVVFDELASLLLDSRRRGEEEADSEARGPSLGKIAQGKLSQLAEKARATGIHLIAATQRSSVKVVEGNIKANFPARLTFRLPSEADSRTILGTSGAEHLLARGDMLFSNPNRPGLSRIHAPIASLEDIRACVEFASRR
jgi:S-DNA-T family DNA segregation ATPase FtsK/SpoIIIE